MTVTDSQHKEDLTKRLVELARDMMLIPSSETRPEDRETCFNFVLNHLEEVDHVQIHEYRNEGFPSLVATPRSVQHPEILLCGHLDVVGYPDTRVYTSCIKDGRLYGPGAGDMKGALAILLELFHNFHARHPGISLGLVVTSDEELGGKHGIGYLFDEMNMRCGCALIPDGGSLNEVTIEEKGILHLKILARGHSAHAARPWLGDNPVEKLTTALYRIREHFDALESAEGEWYPTCAMTMINTPNTTINRIPGQAEAALDIRFPPPHTTKSILSDLRRYLGDGVEADVIIGAEHSHLSPDPLFISTIERITGQPVSRIQESGGSDARFICRYDIPVLMARPLVGNIHSEDEWIDIESMHTFYQICESYIRERLMGD